MRNSQLGLPIMACSSRSREAHQRNALEPTGPRTDAGQAASTRDDPPEHDRAWNALQCVLACVIAAEDRSVMIRRMEEEAADCLEKMGRRGEERAHAGDVLTGPRPRAEADREVRQRKSRYSFLDKDRGAGRQAVGDSAESTKGSAEVTRRALSGPHHEAGPKTENRPVLGTQAPRISSLTTTSKLAQAAPGTMTPRTSESTRVPQSGPIVHPTNRRERVNATLLPSPHHKAGPKTENGPVLETQVFGISSFTTTIRLAHRSWDRIGRRTPIDTNLAIGRERPTREVSPRGTSPECPLREGSEQGRDPTRGGGRSTLGR